MRFVGPGFRVTSGFIGFGRFCGGSDKAGNCSLLAFGVFVGSGGVDQLVW